MVLVLIIIFFGATMQVIKGFGWLSVIYLFFSWYSDISHTHFVDLGS